MSGETPIRGRFGFRVAATSFLIPADWETNVREAGPLVDEIELLFFESRPPESLPTPAVVSGLAELSRQIGVTYNIHLPSDLAPTAEDPHQRRQAARVLGRLIALTAALNPTALVLHLPYEAPDRRPASVRRWQDRAHRFVSDLLAAASGALAPSTLAVENLDYPPSWVWDAVADLGVGFCLDVGHLWMQGQGPAAVFNRYGGNVRLMHLHGVEGARDHLALTALDPAKGRELAGVLSGFTGTAAIEVFNLGDFRQSIAWLTETLAPG